mmetsp:Transcript_26691/g.58115  ORF Transcript_26691/g.58115 Transcript_26691/m.58115 type:complete len:220 (-) Transcript_26691:107-766(-)
MRSRRAGGEGGGAAAQPGHAQRYQQEGDSAAQRHPLARAPRQHQGVRQGDPPERGARAAGGEHGAADAERGEPRQRGEDPGGRGAQPPADARGGAAPRGDAALAGQDAPAGQPAGGVQAHAWGAAPRRGGRGPQPQPQGSAGDVRLPGEAVPPPQGVRAVTGGVLLANAPLQTSGASERMGDHLWLSAALRIGTRRPCGEIYLVSIVPNKGFGQTAKKW